MTASLATREQVAPVSGARCVTAFAGHPVSAGVATSIILGTIALEVPLAMLPLLLAWLGVVWCGSRSKRCRQAVARAERGRALAARRDRRDQRLADAGAPRGGLQEATWLVDEIAKLAPEEAARLELEELLDRFAELAIDEARCRALVLAHDGDALRARRSVLVRQGRMDDLRLKVLERRIACADRCRERLVALHEVLSDLLELLRLTVERVALRRADAEDPGADEAIAERLGWLDDEQP